MNPSIKSPLVFATNNSHKIKEVVKMLPLEITLWSLNDIDCEDDLPETGNTFQANAHQKALYVFEKFGMNCFADDSGLEVVALGGRPGVWSARYAGANGNAEENNKKLLIELKGITDRRATFRTVISLITNEGEHFFEGSIDGTIAESPRGNAGFGYDPLFIPTGFDKTFSELGAEIKNTMSHRTKAVKGLIEHLKIR